jgi:hypothetical protein
LQTAPAKSEKGNVAVPLRRVGQIRLWDGDFLIPFESGSFYDSKPSSPLERTGRSCRCARSYDYAPRWRRMFPAPDFNRTTRCELPKRVETKVL